MGCKVIYKSFLFIYIVVYSPKRTFMKKTHETFRLEHGHVSFYKLISLSTKDFFIIISAQHFFRIEAKENLRYLLVQNPASQDMIFFLLFNLIMHFD